MAPVSPLLIPSMLLASVTHAATFKVTVTLHEGTTAPLETIDKEIRLKTQKIEKLKDSLEEHAVKTQSEVRNAISKADRADGSAEARAMVLRAAFQIQQMKSQPDPPPDLRGNVAVLFFDGGSRGNPGPGGSEAALVQLGAEGAEMRLAWAGSASLANKKTTNNIAEYRGLLWGLTAALRLHKETLHVVGDSALILRQLRTNTPPRSLKLRPLYAQARFLADKIGVASWCHHYRTYNKMADQLANAAMNLCASAQDLLPSSNMELAGAQEFLSNDMGHWLADPNHS